MNKRILTILILMLFILLPINVKAFGLEVKYKENTYTIEAESSDEVLIIKDELEAITEIDSNQIILKSGTTKLSDDRTLADYNIGPKENQIKSIDMTLKQEVKTVKYTITEPVEGRTPDVTADVEVLYENEKLEFKDVTIDWLIIDNHLAEVIENPEEHKFLDKKGYRIKFSKETKEKIEKELSKIDYTITTNTKSYINGVPTTPEANFVINGIKTIDIQSPVLYVGDKLPTKIKAIVKTDKATEEIELDIYGWENDSNDPLNPNFLPKDAVAEEGKIYNFGIIISDEIMSQTDSRTKILIDGKLPEEITSKGITPIKPTIEVEPDIENPETSDVILFYICTLITSLISIAGLYKIKNQEHN